MTSLKWIQKTQTGLFGILIFLIPSNLFLKCCVEYAYVSGVIVDYLLPKLYLSDLIIFSMLTLWTVELTLKKHWHRITRNRNIIALCALSIVFVIFHLATHYSTPYFMSTVWFILKIAQMVLLTAWILAHREILASKVIMVSLLAMVIFQSFLGFFQYLTQHTFFGYWLLGEPNLQMTPTIAKTDYSGVLRILPYGTTVHPNVLAGVFVFISITLLELRTEIKNNKASAFITAAILLLSSTITLLTESLTAFTALVLGLISSIVISRKMKVPKFLVVALTVIILFVIPFQVSQTSSEIPSLLRRRELQLIAVDMFQAHPFWGVGLNQFTGVMHEFGTVSANLRFFQPVHNIPLLMLSELGLAGLLSIFLFIYLVQRMYSIDFRTFGILILPFLLLASLDHYLLSVQTGQLLSAMLVAFSLEKKKSLH